MIAFKMESDCGENFEDAYREEDVNNHEKLVQKVLSLNKTPHLKKSSRTEPALQISEFNLVKSITGAKGSIQINELTKSLKNKKSRAQISENVKRLQKNSHTLPKPLEKPQATRIRRGVAYEKTRLELDRWEATVTANRVSTNLSFPLNNDVKMDKEESENFASMWRVKSKLAEELEKHEPKVEEFHINLEQEKFPLTMKEMLARRREAAKLRAYQGYKEAKARRQSKIKSKKYHRIQKRERIKKKLKEFDQLQKTDPEEALKKLEEIEKCRIEERFSLRHKGTGKWARNQQIRAKYDAESRQNLAQQLAVSRDLTQKSKINESDSEAEEVEAERNPITIDKSNPWINGVKPGEEVSHFVSGYRKYWAEQNEQKLSELEDKEETLLEATDITEKTTKSKEKKLKKEKITKLSKSKSTSEWEVEAVDDEATIEDLFEAAENKLQNKIKTVSKTKVKRIQEKRDKSKLDLPLQKKNPQKDEALIQSTEKACDAVEGEQNLLNLRKILFTEINDDKNNIDPQKCLDVKASNLSTGIPDILLNTEEYEEGDQRAMIAEAFEDDGIIDEFHKEKNDEINKDKPKDIDLNLPGWGSWGGTNVKRNKRKNRRFIIKAPKKIMRKDDNKKFIIINEKSQSKLKEHMVSEVPFPFKTVKDFEASIRAPISNTFVPETAYKKLIKPAVTTKMGTIIEPISKNYLINKNG